MSLSGCRGLNLLPSQTPSVMPGAPGSLTHPVASRSFSFGAFFFLSRCFTVEPWMHVTCPGALAWIPICFCSPVPEVATEPPLPNSTGSTSAVLHPCCAVCQEHFLFEAGRMAKNNWRDLFLLFCKFIQSYFDPSPHLCLHITSTEHSFTKTQKTFQIVLASKVMATGLCSSAALGKMTKFL